LPLIKTANEKRPILLPVPDDWSIMLLPNIATKSLTIYSSN